LDVEGPFKRTEGVGENCGFKSAGRCFYRSGARKISGRPFFIVAPEALTDEA
jgi:hypothetical protein